MLAIGLSIFTIYESPSDFPGEFVARRSVANKFGVWQDVELCARARTLDACRAQLPPDLYRLPRADADDPTIVETWL